MEFSEVDFIVQCSHGVVRTENLPNETVKSRALYYACFYDQLEVAKTLNENGATIVSVFNCLPLMKSLSRKNRIEMIKFILEEVENNIQEYQKTVNEMMIKAIEFNHFDLVCYLIEKGADVNYKDGLALNIASEKGYLQIVIHLFQKDIIFNINNNIALNLAINNHQNEIINFFEKEARFFYEGIGRRRRREE